MVLHRSYYSKNSHSVLQRILSSNKDLGSAYNNSREVLNAIQDVRDDLLDQRIPAALINSLNDVYVSLTNIILLMVRIIFYQYCI